MKHLLTCLAVFCVVCFAGVSPGATDDYGTTTPSTIRAASVAIATDADLSTTWTMGPSTNITGVAVYADVDIGQGTNVKISPAGYTGAIGSTEADSAYAINTAKTQTFTTTGTHCLIFDKSDFGSQNAGIWCVGTGTLTSTSCSLTMRYLYDRTP